MDGLSILLPQVLYAYSTQSALGLRPLTRHEFKLPFMPTSMG